MEVKSDKKEYKFQKYIDEQKHLDTDETRHLMKPIVHVIVEDFKGEEHKYCDKEQCNKEGKFRRPKKLIEAEQKGFKSVSDMVEADKKAEEDCKKKEVEDLREFTELCSLKNSQLEEFTAKQNDVIKKLIDKQDTLEKTIIDQNNLLQEIINRLKK